MNEDRKTTIAIAEDHQIVREGIINFLNSFGGFEVLLTAVNGKDLIDKLSKLVDLPEICILDINMPELNGFETMDILREKFPSIKVLTLSMVENEYAIIKMFNKGARGYVLKDSDPLELKEALYMISNGQLYHPEVNNDHFLTLLQGRNDPNFPKISEKEWQFLPYCCTELSYKEVAKKMGVSYRTVQGYRDSLFDKLKVNTKIGLAMFALRAGLAQL